MFKQKKKLQELEKKISHLEAEINMIYKYVDIQPEKNEKALSYEEVIDLWLNGKDS